MENLHDRVDALEVHLRTVERRLRGWRWLACSLVMLLLMGLLWSSSTAQDEHLAERLRTLAPWLEDVEDTLRQLKQLLAHVTLAKDAEGRLEIIFSGVNLRIVNGLGSTDCTNEQFNLIPNCPNGLGNLIVGYNEPRDFEENIRTGSHNVVVGTEHNFSRFGGVVVGEFNTISGDFASVSGGSLNTASVFGSSVSGGVGNTASGNFSAVSGGEANTARGDFASVSGGRNRTAPGEFDWVAGSLFEDE